MPSVYRDFPLSLRKIREVGGSGQENRTYFVLIWKGTQPLIKCQQRFQASLYQREYVLRPFHNTFSVRSPAWINTSPGRDSEQATFSLEEYLEALRCFHVGRVRYTNDSQPQLSLVHRNSSESWRATSAKRQSCQIYTRNSFLESNRGSPNGGTTLSSSLSCQETSPQTHKYGVEFLN